MLTPWQPTSGVGTDRRKFSRVPLAIPVRYATEEGHVGIGVLIDVHEKGAGLLVPKIAFDVLQVWMQFLWFNDRIGLQGKVIFARDVEEGYHVGLQLELLHPESVRFLTGLVIPYSQRKFALDQRRGLSLLDVLSHRWRHETGSANHRPHLPVLVSQEGLSAWAITEDRDEHGAVLLLPHLPDANTGIALTTWGQLGARWADVVGTERVHIPPVELFRVMVEYEDQPARPAGLPASQFPLRAA